MGIQVRQGIPASKRKLKYVTDAVYRNGAKKQSRTAYRKKANVDTRSCLYSLSFIDNLTEKQQVLLQDKKTAIMPVANVPGTAKALQLLYQTFWRWVNNGVVPGPVLMSMSVKPYPVYHKEEIRILIEEIGDHQKTVSYLRKDHTEVRGRIEQRFSAIRKKLKIN